MNTIIVIYTNKKLVKTEITKHKSYAFNASGNFAVGDMLKSDSYETKMQIVKILDKAFKHYNTATGELSDEYTSTRQWEIKEMVISEERPETIVYASKVDIDKSV